MLKESRITFTEKLKEIINNKEKKSEENQKFKKKRKIEYRRFNVDKILQFGKLDNFPLLKKIFEKKSSISDENVKQELVDCLYGCISKECGM